MSSSGNSFVYPAFRDAHLHFLGLGYTKSLVDLSNATSKSELISRLKKNLGNSILVGRGWNHEELQEKSFLTKDDLDQVSKVIPIIAIRVCGHIVSVNSAALEKIAQMTPLNEDTAKGILKEDEIRFAYSLYDKPTKEQLLSYLKIADDICLKNGITKVASDDFCIFPLPFTDIMDAIVTAYESNLIHVEITEQINLSKEDFELYLSLRNTLPKHPKYHMGPLKVLADGSLGGKSAALKLPYEHSTEKGILNYREEELFSLFKLAIDNEMDIAVHAIGDLATEVVLQQLELSMKGKDIHQFHHSIVHAQMADKQAIETMKRLNVGAIVQPIFLNSDLTMLDERIGSRKQESYLFHTMLQRGIQVAFSTDSPVEEVNPFENIYVSITQRSIKHPSLVHLNTEAFTMNEALACYTTGTFPYVFGDSIDEIILDTDLLNAKPDQIKIATVLETKIAGNIVYKKN